MSVILEDTINALPKWTNHCRNKRLPLWCLSLVRFPLAKSFFCQNHKVVHRCGGQVVSVLAFYSVDPSSNPAYAYSFFLKFVIEKNENKQKRGRGWSIFKHQSGIERSSKNKKTQKCLNVHYCVNWLFLQFYNLLLQWTSILPWLGIRKFFPNKEKDVVFIVETKQTLL